MITWAWCRRFGQRFPERRGSGVTHFVRNLQAHVPKPAQPMVATLVRSIFAQPSTAEVRAQLDRVITQLQETFPKAAGILADAAPDITAFCSFPPEHWRQIWSNNPQERLNREIRRRTDVVGIFPNRDSIIRLVGAVLAEQHDRFSVFFTAQLADRAADRIIERGLAGRFDPGDRLLNLVAIRRERHFTARNASNGIDGAAVALFQRTLHE